MHRSRSLLGLLLAAGLTGPTFAQSPPTETVFQDDQFPKTFFFRQSLASRAQVLPQAEFDQLFGRLQGICGKLLPFELFQIPDRFQDPVVFVPWDPDVISDRYRDFKTNHPNQVALVHINGRAIDPQVLVNPSLTGPPWDTLDRLNSGHFLYLRGVSLADQEPGSVDQLLSPGETVVHMMNGPNLDNLFRLDTGLTKDVPLEPGEPDVLPDFPDQVCIVECVNGVFQWETAEHADLAGIDNAGRTLTLVRNTVNLAGFTGDGGTFDPNATDTDVWIFPHAHGGPWGKSNLKNSAGEFIYNGRLLWFLNFARDEVQAGSGANYAQPDAQGDTASVVMSDFYEDCFETLFDGLDGMEFDVASWDISETFGGRKVDLNLDGTGDGAVLDSENEYGQGVMDYYAAIRAKIPADKLFMADAGTADNQRATGLFLTGTEAEFLGDVPDPDFRQWSWGMNRLAFWNLTNLEAERELHYGVHKLQGGPLPDDSRLIMAAFTINGSPIVGGGQTLAPTDLGQIIPPDPIPVDCADSEDCVEWSPPGANDREFVVTVFDEFTRGTDGVIGWLGAPATDMIRLARSSDDLLDGEGVDFSGTFESLWTGGDMGTDWDLGIDGSPSVDSSDPTAGSTIFADTALDFLVFTPDPGPISGDQLPKGSAKLSLGYVPPGDLTIFATMWADAMDGFINEGPSFPDRREIGRLVEVRAHNTDTSVVSPPFDDDGDFIERLGFHKALVNSRAVETSFAFRGIGGGNVELEFIFEGSGDVFLSRFEAFSGPDVIARGFEGGVVLANPSFEEVAISLATLFPGREFRRLDDTDPGNTANTGQPVDDVVVLPAVDGLFLKNEDPVAADFTVTPAYVAAGSDVVFSSKSFGPATSYSWTLDSGDGTPLSNTNATFVAINMDAGAYTVELEISDGTNTVKKVLEDALIVANNVKSQTFNAQDPWTVGPLGTSTEWDFREWTFDRYADLNLVPLPAPFMGYFESQFALPTEIWQTLTKAFLTESARVFLPPDKGWAQVSGTAGGVTQNVALLAASANGDGVFYSAYVGEEPVWGPNYLEADDTTGLPPAFGIALESDEELAFRLDMANTPVGDFTFLAPVVDYTWGGRHPPGVGRIQARVLSQDSMNVTYELSDATYVGGTGATRDWDLDDDGVYELTATTATKMVPRGFSEQVGLQLTQGTNVRFASIVLTAPADTRYTDSVADYVGPALCGANPIPTEYQTGANGWWFHAYGDPTMTGAPAEYVLFHQCVGLGNWGLEGEPMLGSGETLQLGNDAFAAARSWVSPADGLASIDVGFELLGGNTSGVELRIFRHVGASSASSLDGTDLLVWGPVTFTGSMGDIETAELEIPIQAGDSIVIRTDAGASAGIDDLLDVTAIISVDDN